MNVSQNGPRTLGAALGLLPSAVVGVIVAFAGTTWTPGQTAAVVVLGGVVGSVLGFWAGDRVQKNYTEPKS